MRPVSRRICILILAALFLALPKVTEAQRLRITGGDVTLTLGPPTVPGGDPTPVTDSSRRLMWLQIPRFGVYKVMVSTAIASQSFELYVTPTAVRNGTPMPTVQLSQGMPPVDFIRDISRLRPVGRATLQYRAEAPAENGNTANQGSDVHTVIYTWTAQ